MSGLMYDDRIWKRAESAYRSFVKIRHNQRRNPHYFYLAGSDVFLFEEMHYYFAKDYIYLLERTNPALFPLLSASEKQRTLTNLKRAFYFLCANHQRGGLADSLSGHREQILYCASLIAKLQGDRFDECLLTLPLSPLDSLRDDKLGCVTFILEKNLEFVGHVNMLRLFWVWAGDFIAAGIRLSKLHNNYLPGFDDFLRPQSQVLLVNSWASSLLYCGRLIGLNGMLLFLHAIIGPALQPEEHRISCKAALKEQWQKRKYTIINDFFWGIGNATNIKEVQNLLSPTYMGWVSLVVCGILLLGVDALLVSTQRYKEKEQEHKAYIETLTLQLEELLKKKRRKNTTQQIYQEQLELLAIESQLARAELDFASEKSMLSLDISYSVLMAVFFSLSCSFYLPFPGSAAANVLLPFSGILNIAGSLINTLLTIIYEVSTQVLAHEKAHKNATLLLIEAQKMIEAYRTLLTSGKDASLTLEKKHLYLEIIARILEAENTIALTNYHSGISFILFTIVKGSFSALPVVAFTFLSQGAAIGVIIAAFVVCYAIKMLIDKFAPKPAIVKNNASETELANFERHLHHSSRDSRRISLDSDTEERRTDSISRPNSHLLRQKASLSTPSPLSYLRGLCKNPFFLGKKTQDNRASYAGSADAEPLLSPS